MTTKRRGANEGSIYQRKDGRWVGVVQVGYGGGRRERKAYYGGTRKEVAGKVAEALRDLGKGRRPVMDEREKIRDYLSRWLSWKQHEVRATTYAAHERAIRLHVNPNIGDLRTAQLTAAELKQLYSRLLRNGLSPKSVRNIHGILHNALSEAVKDGAVAGNAASAVRPPEIPLYQFRALSADEARRLLEAAQIDRFHALYVLAVTCGLRQAELLGLRWADVDLDGAVLSVRQQVYRLRGEWVVSEPKTKKGRRAIALPSMAVEALRHHRDRQEFERFGAGADWQEKDLVFPNRTGNPCAKENLLRRSFWPLLERAGLPRIRFHDLRHSAASLLLSEGVHPKIVQEVLGHSTIAVTMDIYSHVMPTMQKDAAAKVDRLLAAAR